MVEDGDGMANEEATASGNNGGNGSKRGGGGNMGQHASNADRGEREERKQAAMINHGRANYSDGIGDGNQRRGATVAGRRDTRR